MESSQSTPLMVAKNVRSNQKDTKWSYNAKALYNMYLSKHVKNKTCHKLLEDNQQQGGVMCSLHPTAHPKGSGLLILFWC